MKNYEEIIKDLEAKLAESEKESLKYFKEYRAWKEKCELLEQDQIKFAISELEKVINNIPLLSVKEIVENQIARLRGKY